LDAARPRQSVPATQWYPLTGAHSITTQKTTIEINIDNLQIYCVQGASLSLFKVRVEKKKRVPDTLFLEVHRTNLVICIYA
jgi:hypothetical protein